MKITRNQLRRIIREELQLETMGVSDPDIRQHVQVGGEESLSDAAKSAFLSFVEGFAENFALVIAPTTTYDALIALGEELKGAPISTDPIIKLPDSE
jgi:hypothetical protein